jgi:7,8-dihydropterin-6-yl-methyl-4-(beta-D-ribofuranosyl)aminobenzene 5'-phosphate synthase
LTPIKGEIKRVTATVQRVVVTTVVENYVDMLLADEPRVTRAGLAHHFDPKKQNPIGENGVALHVKLEWDRYEYNILFDTAMSGKVMLHNAAALGLDMGALDHIVISHGHPDHYGGLIDLLASRPAPVPVSLGEAAFVPRYLRLASGQVAPFYNQGFTREAIERVGGRVVAHDGALEVGPGTIATGAIPREVDFEMPSQNITTPNALIQVVKGHMGPDSVPDDQAMVVNVGEDGIVIFVGCSHAGIINTIRQAIELSGRSRVLGVFGGFHLGFPGTPEAKTLKTIEALKEMEVELLCPMHCTGMQAMMQIRSAFPDRFLLNCTGTQVVLSA